MQRFSIWTNSVLCCGRDRSNIALDFFGGVCKTGDIISAERDYKMCAEWPHGAFEEPFRLNRDSVGPHRLRGKWNGMSMYRPERALNVSDCATLRIRVVIVASRNAVSNDANRNHRS